MRKNKENNNPETVRMWGTHKGDVFLEFGDFILQKKVQNFIIKVAKSNKIRFI